MAAYLVVKDAASAAAT